MSDLTGSEGTDYQGSGMMPSPMMQVPVGDPRNVQDLTAFVQNMLQQMQERFHQMSEEIVSRIDDMSTRIDDLEKNIADVMTQAGVDYPPPGSTTAAQAPTPASNTK